MAAPPPEPTLPRMQAASPGDAAPAALEAAWNGLQRQAGELAKLARIAPDRVPADQSFNQLLANARPWQTTLLAQGIDDVAAMLGSGMTALSTLSGRGQDTTAPALALWREFHAARCALLAVLHFAESN